MPRTHVITKTCNDGSETIGRPVTITADGGDEREIELAANATNILIAWITDVSQLKSFFMVADGACSVFQNAPSTGSPAKTIVLAANQPFDWNNLEGAANPFGSTDTTAFYATNPSSTVPVTLKIKQLVDATV